MPLSAAYDGAGSVEAEAALAFGRLEGALRYLPADVAQILAARLLREALTGALCQERHAFTAARFAAWFAGLTTLTDAADRPSTALRPPRPMAIAILTEFTHSSWAPLASLALRMRSAFLAFADGEVEYAHGDAQALIDEARALLQALPTRPATLPFSLLAQLHDAAAHSTTFAPGEPEALFVDLGDRHGVVQRPAAPSPRWALELVCGEAMRAASLLPVAVPLIGLIRLDALRADENEEARIIRATALRDLALQLTTQIDEARGQADQLDTVKADRRSHSRIPMMFELLAGFGPLRSSQLVALLGATRLGVSKMLAGLNAAGVLERSTIGGVQLYSIRVAPTSKLTANHTAAPVSVSSAAIADYEASIENIDNLLLRLGVEIKNEDNAAS